MTGRRQKLAAAVHAAVNVEWCETPFQWGVSDCLLALADIIEKARGYDPAAPFRGRYNSALGAMRVTKDYGGFAGALEWQARNHLWKEIDPKTARVGDVGVVLNSQGPRCGVICNGRHFVGRRLGEGFIAVERKDVFKAWRVT